MIARRDLIIGAACLAAAGSAYALEPRKRLTLLSGAKLEDVLARQAGDWTSRDVTDLVAPREEDSLASRLYSDTVGRVYLQQATGAELMMLAAYGDSQSNQLMLHRPETCYPASGLRIVSSEPFQLALAPGVNVPARRLVAEAPGRREAIIYWSRLGEALPIDGRQQRIDRVRTAMSGYVADGLLMRFSGVSSDPAAVFARIEAFAPQLVRAAPPAQRPALIGTQLASRFA